MGNLFGEVNRIHSMRRIRDGFKTPCLGGSRNIRADALSSDVLSNIQGLMRCQLKTVFSVADMDTANTESCGLGEKKLP